MTQMTVYSYLKCIPPGNKNEEKPAILKNFVKGVKAVGDIGQVYDDYNWRKSDVAIIQGFVHEKSKNVPHLQLRKTIIDQQRQNDGRTIVADANLFLYADQGNSKTYLRYSYDGIFPTTGEYCDDNPNPDRWEKISNDLGIHLKPWKTGGKYILICCQRDGGWSMQGNRVVPWVNSIIRAVSDYTTKPIKIRFHPGDKKKDQHMRYIWRLHRNKVKFSQPSSTLLEDLQDAHCVVNHNSSPGVVAAIEGVPVFLLDPNRSQAKEVANQDLRNIENVQYFDRELWIQRVAQSHWTLDELRSGQAWEHMKKYARK